VWYVSITRSSSPGTLVGVATRASRESIAQMSLSSHLAALGGTSSGVGHTDLRPCNTYMR